MKGPEITAGSAKLIPILRSNSRTAEPAAVKAKLTRNWMLNRRSLPNISDWARADKTNIHAKPQIKVVTSGLEYSQFAIKGTGSFKPKATLSTAR